MRLSLYSGNLSTYYKSITLVEGKNSCTSLICILSKNFQLSPLQKNERFNYFVYIIHLSVIDIQMFKITSGKGD